MPSRAAPALDRPCGRRHRTACSAPWWGWGFAASQYALLTSLCALTVSLVAGTSGFATGALGFGWFFTATALIGAPVALLCWWLWRLQGRAAGAVT